MGRNPSALEEVASSCKAAAKTLVCIVLISIFDNVLSDHLLARQPPKLCWSTSSSFPTISSPTSSPPWYSKVVTIAADLSKEEAPAQTVKEAVEKLGGHLILWNTFKIHIHDRI